MGEQLLQALYPPLQIEIAHQCFKARGCMIIAVGCIFWDMARMGIAPPLIYGKFLCIQQRHQFCNGTRLRGGLDLPHREAVQCIGGPVRRPDQAFPDKKLIDRVTQKRKRQRAQLLRVTAAI